MEIPFDSVHRLEESAEHLEKDVTTLAVFGVLSVIASSSLGGWFVQQSFFIGSSSQQYFGCLTFRSVVSPFAFLLYTSFATLFSVALGARRQRGSAYYCCVHFRSLTTAAY